MALLAKSPTAGQVKIPNVTVADDTCVRIDHFSHKARAATICGHCGARTADIR